MFDSHVFIAARVPNAHELHCLVAHLANKKEIVVKVERNGRVISVICESQALNLWDGKVLPVVQIETNLFELRRTVLVKPYAVEVDDIATISVNLCYSIHHKGLERNGNLSSKTTVPFDVRGRILPRWRKHFLDYLEGQTGLKLYELDDEKQIQMVAEIVITPEPCSRDEVGKAGDVWFVGGCHVSIRARINDALRFATLSGRAIGNRKSYGFGSVLLGSIEAAADVAGYMVDSEVEAFIA